MTERRHALERIAEALERIAPPTPGAADWLSHPAYIWGGETARAIKAIDAPALSVLRAIDEQKSALTRNLDRLASGAAAHDMLLWGSRGMGKSALVRSAIAALNEVQPGKLALVQLLPGSLGSLAALVDALAAQDRAFLLFIDDLGFGAGDTQDNLALRSLLDGGVVARPGKIRLAVTSNRRAIVERKVDVEEALHERDERDNALALADRFGLTLGFHPCNREDYLEILRAYTDSLGLEVDEEEALAFAIARGHRSGRTAHQFACELAGRAGIPI